MREATLTRDPLGEECVTCFCCRLMTQLDCPDGGSRVCVSVLPVVDLSRAGGATGTSLSHSLDAVSLSDA